MNKREKIFDYYGHLDNSRQDYSFPTTLTALPDNFTCTVYLADGMNREEFIALPYPCRGAPDQVEENPKKKKKKKGKE